MLFEIITLPILFFILLNFLIIFFIQKEIDRIIACVFSYIIIVFFFSTTTTNHELLKDLILILSCYQFALLFIIHKFNILDVIEKKSPTKFRKFLVFPAIILGISITFVMVAFIITNISEISKAVEAKKFVQKNEELFKNLDSNQKLLNQSDIKGDKIEANIVKLENKELNKEEKWFNISKRKRYYIKEKLSENFLFKRSSEIILLIISLPLIAILKRQFAIKNN